MITINDLRVSYKDVKALDIDRKIEINAHDRVGVIGSNGAGKTTFVKACLGILPYEGTIATEVAPNQMSVHMQFNEYVDTMSVKNVMETILNTDVDKNPKLQELINFFNFNDHLKKHYKNLSGGLKQRFTLILVLMQDSPITFFDEVTTGLDFSTRQSLIDKILEWYDHKESCIIFITHYYEELERLTNKLMILDAGKLIDFGDTKELFRKYCGHSVVTFNANQIEHTLIDSYKKIIAPEGMLALSCKTPEEEMGLVQLLVEKNVSFKRSNYDIEILSMNAIGGNKK